MQTEKSLNNILDDSFSEEKDFDKNENIYKNSYKEKLFNKFNKKKDNQKLKKEAQ